MIFIDMKDFNKLIEILTPLEDKLEKNILERYVKHLNYQKIKNLNDFFQVEYDILQNFYPKLTEKGITQMLSEYLAYFKLSMQYIIYFNHLNKNEVLNMIIDNIHYEKEYVFTTLEMYLDELTLQKLLQYVIKRETTTMGLISTQYGVNLTNINGIQRFIR
jgi:hypothetical protein